MTPRVVIVSRRWKWKTPGVVVYVGRAIASLDLEGSVLGNPFRIEEDSIEERRGVIAQYKLWFDEQRKDPASLVSIELARLTAIVRSGERLVLSCWCAPLPCHAEVIRDAILESLEGPTEQLLRSKR